MIELCDYLGREHEADINNIKFGGDEIKSLGGTLTLAADEAEGTLAFVSTNLKNRF